MTTPTTIPMCTCGRPATAPHCSACGSAVVYAVKSKNRIDKLAAGVVNIVRAFQCRRCGQLFYEDALCAAPPKKVGATPRSRSPIEKRLEKSKRDNPLSRNQVMFAAAKKFPINAMENPDNFPLTDEQWDEIRELARKQLESGTATQIEVDPEDAPLTDTSHDDLFRR